jgi:hypothetical protein
MALMEKHNIPDSPRMVLCLELLPAKEGERERKREGEGEGEGERDRERERETEIWRWVTHNICQKALHLASLDHRLVPACQLPLLPYIRQCKDKLYVCL